jgi:hypothetical protein
VPAVPGLLEYRKDNKKLYVRENDTWEVIAQEKKVFGNNININSTQIIYRKLSNINFAN